MRGDPLYTGGLGDRVPIDPEIAGQAVRAYLREIGAYSDQPGLRFRVAVRDQSLVVRVSTPLDLSITVGGITETRGQRDGIGCRGRHRHVRHPRSAVEHDGLVLQSATALVGRDAELSRLGELLDAAARGRGGGAVLLGEAGIGKTAVAAAAATAAESRGFTVAWGRCPELSPSPYWPWRQLLVGLGPKRLVDDVKLGSRAELFASVLATLEKYAADGPLALFLDDVHRADEGSLELLAFVASQLQGTPIVLVATSRDDALELNGPAGSALAGLPLSVLRLELGGLDPEETTALVRALNRSASDELVASIQRRTAGNPFFVSEVARLYATRERQGADAGIEVPKAVQHVLSRRFARLGQDAVGMLEVAAVIGEPDVQMLAAVTGRSETAVLELLDEPMQARLLAGTGRELRFAHDLVREALYAGLSEPTRARLHRSVAECHAGLRAGCAGRALGQGAGPRSQDPGRRARPRGGEGGKCRPRARAGGALLPVGARRRGRGPDRRPDRARPVAGARR